MRYRALLPLPVIWIACHADAPPKGTPQADSAPTAPDTSGTPPDTAPDTSAAPFTFPADLPPVEDRIAVLIVVDGLRTDESTASTPSPATGLTGPEAMPGVWSRFGASGLALSAILNTGNTTTFPAHTVLFTGRPSPLWNVPSDGVSSLYRPELPGIFQAAAARCGADRVHLLANAPLLADSSGTLYPGQRSEGHMDDIYDSDSAVLDRFREVYTADPCLVVLNLHETDFQGHDDPVSGYPATVSTVDQQIAELWDWLAAEQPDRFRRTLTVLTSDHGRHRDGPVFVWADHGDSCGGCREVPLFIAGPGVQVGTGDLQPQTHEDLSRLVAAWLDLEMPFATGVLPGWIAGLEAPAPSGPTSIAAAGGHVAAAVLTPGSPLARSALTLDSLTVSSPDAIAVADPVLAATDAALLLCWRELRHDDADRWPWVPRCLYRAGDTTIDLGLPATEIEPAPVFAAALDPDGAPVVAWLGNKNFDADAGINVHRWDGTQWQLLEWQPLKYISSPQIVADRLGWLLSVGANPADTNSRDYRRAHLINTDAVQILPPPVAEIPTRTERTALRRDPDTGLTAVAAITADPQSLHLLLWQIDAGGLRPAATLPVSGDLLPHISPRWQGDTLYWAVLLDGNAAICHLQIPAVPDPAATPACASVSAPWIDSFAVQPDGTVIASVAAAPGQWQLLTLSP